MLSLRPGMADVVAPGIDARFSPGATRDPQPTVVAVGRLVPVKRYDLLISAAAVAPHGPRSPHRHRRRGLPAARSRRGGARTGCRGLGELRRPPLRRGAGGAVPAGLGGGLGVGSRGLGDVAHRGRRLRHAGRRHADQAKVPTAYRTPEARAGFSASRHAPTAVCVDCYLERAKGPAMTATNDTHLQWAVAEEFAALADFLASVDEDRWNDPSLCGGWRVPHVVAPPHHGAGSSDAGPGL